MLIADNSLGHGQDPSAPGAGVMPRDSLPAGAEGIVEQALSGERAWGEGFSDLLGEPTLTVGIPIRTELVVSGTVLLHAPVNGLDEAVGQALSILRAGAAGGPGPSETDFVANVSHELRTPVAALRESLEALQDSTVSEQEEASAYYAQMLAESRRLERLVNVFGEQSRLQDAQFRLEAEEIAPCDVVRDAAQAIRQRA